MRIITLALATVFLLSGSAPAQQSHTIKEGQTLSHVAAKYGVSQQALLKANHLKATQRLKIGQKIVIPRAGKSATPKLASHSKPSTASKGGSYVVRDGENDWAIAKRLGISVSDLHRINPKTDWRRLKVGQSVRAPGKGSARTVLTAAPSKKASGTGAYSVQKNDNDWIIARRVGTTPSQLRALNPGVKWTNLQIGQSLRVPGGKGSGGHTSLAVNKISTRHAKIAKDDVTIRRGPSTNSAKVSTVPAGTYVTVLDRESGWYKLKFPKGTVGWVRGDMLKPLSSRLVAQASTRTRRSNYASNFTPAPSRPLVAGSSSVVDTAMSMIGTRYRMGSASRSATDCSGLMLQAYRAHGIKLPRTSREQAKVGQAVKKDELKAGDLVFFTRGHRIGHVGMYIGNGKFVHASSSGRGVRTDSLNSGTYQRRYVGARRIANLSAKEKADLKKLEAEAQEMTRKAKQAEKNAIKGESEPAFEPAPKDPTPPSKSSDEGKG